MRRLLAQADWARLQSKLEEAGFWASPEWDERVGLDGETWVIEGRRGDTYHCSSQWSPPAGSYRDLGCVFAELAGMEMPHDRP